MSLWSLYCGGRKRVRLQKERGHCNSADQGGPGQTQNIKFLGLELLRNLLTNPEGEKTNETYSNYLFFFLSRRGVFTK